MQISLDQLRLGSEAVVTEIDVDAALQCRLRDFGLVPGTKVRARYRSPDRSVTALELRGSVLALRTRDMKNIRVRC